MTYPWGYSMKPYDYRLDLTSQAASEVDSMGLIGETCDYYSTGDRLKASA